jgi:S-adenosylmethionine synthetase
MKKQITCESVRRGHPDKLCDRISDAILDHYIEADPVAHCGVEVMAANKTIILAGEISSKSDHNAINIARQAIESIGYKSSDFDFQDLINSQSPDIRQGVDLDDGEVGAGDQTTCVGYATNETPEMLPLPFVLAQKMCKVADEYATANPDCGILPDGKGMVTVGYDIVDGETVTSIDKILLSLQHSEELAQSDVRSIVTKYILPKALEGYDYSNADILVNPTGRFVIGGPNGDCGLTGRKIVVDNYGCLVPTGGGCFSGKSPQKVDRSAAYMARYIAKNIVAAGLGSECTVTLSYAIGVAQPVSVDIKLDGMSNSKAQAIATAVCGLIDLTPKGIIDKFKLRRPIYTPTSAYGHFGHSEYPWEKTDIAESLKNIFNTVTGA